MDSELQKKVEELTIKVDKILMMMYCERVRSVERIISEKITDSDIICEELDKLLDYIEDKRYETQFWKMLNYAEKFDSGIGAMYRRQEEVLSEGF